MTQPNHIIEDDITAMVVDDSKAMRKIVMRMLNDAHINSVIEADSGEQALTLIADKNHSTPDIIISDLHMDRMDGMELLNHLRLHKIMIPVLILTADPDHMIHDVARQVGAAKVLMKPITGSDLIKEIGVATGFSIAPQASVESIVWS